MDDFYFKIKLGLIPGFRSPEYVDRLYRNDGLQFDDNYHDRQIERYVS